MSLRVLHAPASVGGNTQALSDALREAGVASETLALQEDRYGYRADRFLWSPTDGLVRRELKRVRAVAAAAFRYDVIHYNFGTTIAWPVRLQAGATGLRRWLARAYDWYTWTLQGIELRLHSWRGRGLVVTYQGNDARQGDYSLQHFDFTIATQVPSSYYTPETDEFKRRAIRRMDRYCDAIYSVNPDLLRVLPARAKFIPYTNIRVDQVNPCYVSTEGRKLRIGHAPSDRRVKGTDLVVATADRIREDGYDFELVMIEGLSHAEAMSTYRDIDVMIDQLFAGWYGGLAVEVMALGKPVMSYIRQDDLQFIPAEMAADLPIINVDPESIERQLRAVLDMPAAALLELGVKSRSYVERWHDPRSIARDLLAVYRQVAPGAGRAC
jgi:hypothetical protein